MPKSKILELLAKFAAEPEKQTFLLPPGENALSFSKEQENAGYDLQMKLRLVLTEMNDEMGTLKMRGFDPEMHKMFNEVRNHLHNIYQNIDLDNPVGAAKELIAYLDNRNTKAVLGNLEFLSKHHLKQTNVQMPNSKVLVHPQIRSFGLLPKLQEVAQRIVKNEPASAKPETIRAIPVAKEVKAPAIPGPAGLPSDL